MEQMVVVDMLLKVADLISASVAPKKENRTQVEIIVSLLRVKALEHAQCALDILKGHAYAEAIIILRAAYEAVIVALYLEQQPDKLAHYRAFHEMVDYRNTLELLELVRQDLTAKELLENEQVLETSRKQIINSGNLQYFKNKGIVLSESDLHDLAIVKRVSNVAQFVPLGLMRTTINFADENQFFQEGFIVYNIGSQVAHSHFNVIQQMYIRPRGPHVLYPWKIIARVILNMLAHTYKKLVNYDFMNKKHSDVISKTLQAASDLIAQMADSQVMQNEDAQHSPVDGL